MGRKPHKMEQKAALIAKATDQDEELITVS